MYFMKRGAHRLGWSRVERKTMPKWGQLKTKSPTDRNFLSRGLSYLGIRVVLGIVSYSPDFHQFVYLLLLFPDIAAAFGNVVVTTEGRSEWAAEPAAEPPLPSLAPYRNPCACRDPSSFRSICSNLGAREHRRS